MVELLNRSCREGRGQPEGTLTVMHQNRTGRPGRPRLEIDPQFLPFALEVRGPTGVAQSLGCHPRTIRRRAIELNILPPGEAPFHTVNNNDGTTTQVRHGVPRHTRMSIISDNELDEAVGIILRDFPSFGRLNINGSLRARGIRVSKSRIRDSYIRVLGIPPPFIRRRITRRRYSVPGANFTWHHDGHHGLIRYKLVTHGFIDGRTRLVPIIRVHDNNRALTVLSLFHEGRQRYGTPMKLRGDHGVENIKVAYWMDQHRGKGSYIWGK
jgi:hypothetical protein